MKKPTLALLGILTVAGAVGIAYGQAGPGPRPEGRPGRGPRPLGAVQDPGVLKEQLGLTDQQLAQFEKIRTDQRRLGIRRRADTQLARLELGQLLEAQTVDEKAVAARVKELTDLHGAALRARIDGVVQMKKILTPEQQEKLKHLRAQRPRVRRPGQDEQEMGPDRMRPPAPRRNFRGEAERPGSDGYTSR